MIMNAMKISSGSKNKIFICLSIHDFNQSTSHPPASSHTISGRQVSCKACPPTDPDLQLFCIWLFVF